MNGDRPSQGRQGFLNITFEGLCLFDMRPESATVYFLDGKKAGVGEHFVVLETQAPHLVTTTLEPAPSHIIHAAAGTRAWTAPRDFGEITGPFNGGAHGLAYRVSHEHGIPTKESARLGPGSHAWLSLDHVADLHVLCGATKIKRDAAFVGRMELKRGELHGRPPTASGGSVVWTFQNRGTHRTVAQQILTDTVLYSVPIEGDSVTLAIGQSLLRLRRVDAFGQAISLFVRTLPADPQMHGMKMTTLAPLNLHHFKAFYRVVNATFEPKVSSKVLPHDDTRGMTGRQGGEVEPFFCPPAMLIHRDIQGPQAAMIAH